MYTPTYSITNKLLRNIASIEAAKEIIVNAPLVPLWERNFQEEALIRTVHFSTQIEENDLSLDQAKEIINNTKDFDLENRDVREVINYREVMEYISESFDISVKSTDITKDVLLDVHRIITNKLVSPAHSGFFRKLNVKTVNSNTGELGLKPLDYKQVELEVDELFKWLNSEETKEASVVINSGILHYRITAIHPFIEGNGRTARAMSTLYLFKYGYDIRRFFCLDEYFARNSESYFSHLSKTDKSKDLTLWLEYFSEGLMKELDVVKRKILNISNDVRKRNAIGQVGLNERQLRIIDFIEKNGSIANKEWRILFPNLSDDTILRDINKLLSSFVIQKRGSTKSAVYVLA